MKSSKAAVLARFHKTPQVRFCEDHQLTSYAGLVVFIRLFQRLDLRRRLGDCFKHHPVRPIFGWGGLVLLLVVHLLLGFRRLRGMDFYRHDPLVRRVMGMRTLPDVATVSRALAAADAPAVEKVGAQVRSLALRDLAAHQLARVTLDFDGSVLSTKAHAEGSAVGYNPQRKGERSYYPLFCTIAQTGQFLDVLHRRGNVHDSEGAKDFMLGRFLDVRRFLPRAKLECRLDSAFFSEQILGALTADRVDYSCSVPFERFPQLKEMIEARERWRAIDDRWSFFEDSRWRPGTWDLRARFLFIRQRVVVQRKGPLQLDLFEPRSHEYEYKVVVTNKTEGADAVVQFHNGRGSQENVFGQAKQHAGLDVIPSKSLHGNQLFTTCAMLAHNLSRTLQMQAAGEPERNTSPTRAPLWRFEELGTLRQGLLHLAGRLINPNNELTLDVPGWSPVREYFRRFLMQDDAPAETTEP